MLWPKMGSVYIVEATWRTAASSCRLRPLAPSPTKFAATRAIAMRVHLRTWEVWRASSGFIPANRPRGSPVTAHTMTSVSYTHLRAHETRHDLVCRLLLEKKKTYRYKKIL